MCQVLIVVKFCFSGIPCANEEHKRFAESHNIPYLDVLQTQPNGSTVLVKSERVNFNFLEHHFNHMMCNSKSQSWFLVHLFLSEKNVRCFCIIAFFSKAKFLRIFVV